MPRRPTAGARDRILDTAAALFYARGVRAVGLNDVIGAAGCGKNLLYTHFPTKADLVAAYLDRFRTMRRTGADTALRAHDGDAAAQLVALTAEVADRVADPRFRGCAMRNYLAEFPDTDDDPARVARDYLHGARAQVAALVDQLGVADPAGLTERIWLVHQGLYGERGPAAGATAVALVGEILARGREG